MSDRRETGVNEVLFEDDNGGTMRMVTATGKTAQTIIGLVVGIFTIIGGVYVAVQKGINVEIEDAVEEMAADPNSGLHLQMHNCAEEEAELVAGAVQDDLDIFETEQKIQGESIVRIETNLENLDEKIDTRTQAIIDEIRRERGGGG